MRSAFYQPLWDPRRGSLRRRSAAVVLTLVAHILVVLLLLRLAPTPPTPPAAEPPPLTFRMLPDARVAPTRASRDETVARVKRASSGASPPPSKAAVAPAATPATPRSPLPPFPAMLPGGLALFDAGDRSRLPSHPEDDDSGNAGASGPGDGKDSVAAYGPGEGPGGERLYDAQWYREPTHAELAYYLPSGVTNPGWALIACRTVANYRVDDCRALGESPIGSGLARAMRQAAWQFRVLPPRIGGRSVIGAWVRIRIDWTDRAMK